MADFSSYHRSFAGGEVTEEFFGQIADAKFQTGLARCENWLVMPHGPITNRPGFKFVRLAKTAAKRARLIPFYFSLDQTLVIEMGEEYFRFHTLGQTVLDGGVPYEVGHPYQEDEIADVRVLQSGDVVTLIHPAHPVWELRRLGVTNWTMTTVAFTPALLPPTGLSATPTPGSTPGTPFDTDYVVTALLTETDESLQSAVTTASNNLYDDGAFNTLAWSAVAGATRYNVYKKSAGLFGYIGQTSGLSFKDDNIAPDPGRTPPLDIDLFDAPGKYPRAGVYYDQRRGFASSDSQPQNVWLSKSATETNFNYSIPKQDADSLQFKIASRGGDGILDMVDLEDIILTTPGGIWRVNGGPTEVLLPDTLNARKVLGAEAGAANVTPVVVGAMLYVAALGGHVREFGIAEGGRYRSGDVSLRAPHLFDGYAVTRFAYQPAPFPVVWACSTSGKLLGLTYVPEEQIGAWHQHTTQGEFEDAAVVTEGGQAVLYAIVKRNLEGVDVRCVERMEPYDTRAFTDPATAYFLDCGATFDTTIDGDGDPVSSISGIDWLEGETVRVVGDGAVIGDLVVTGGAITFPEGVEASVVHFGLPYSCKGKSLPIALEATAYGQTLNKNINGVIMRLYRSYPPKWGPDFDTLRETKIRTSEPMGDAVALKTGVLETMVDPEWSMDGCICFQHDEPLPCTILSFALDMALGGG